MLKQELEKSDGLELSKIIIQNKKSNAKVANKGQQIKDKKAALVHQSPIVQNISSAKILKVIFEFASESNIYIFLYFYIIYMSVCVCGCGCVSLFQ